MVIDIYELKKKFDVDKDHLWGYQIRMENNDKYCAKLMVLKNKKPGSLHYHKIKDETFIVLSGEVVIARPHFFPERGMGSIFSKVGGVFHIPVGVKHQMQATKPPAIILEVSTHDDDNDTYRV